MPIQTSSITGTRAHKHTNPSSDGGFLDANSITGFSNLTEGGIMQGDNSNQATNLSLGNAAQILKVNAGATALEYSSTLTNLSTQQSLQTGIFTTGSATYVQVGNGMALTLPNRSGGKALVIANYSVKNTVLNSNYVSLFDDGVTNGIYQTYYGTTDVPCSIAGIFDTDGSTISLYCRCSGGSMSIIQSGTDVVGSICSFELS